MIGKLGSTREWFLPSRMLEAKQHEYRDMIADQMSLLNVAAQKEQSLQFSLQNTIRSMELQSLEKEKAAAEAAQCTKKLSSLYADIDRLTVELENNRDELLAAQQTTEKTMSKSHDSHLALCGLKEELLIKQESLESKDSVNDSYLAHNPLIYQPTLL